MKDVQEACRKGGIERFETPQRVKVVTEAWTPETGLVTDALKLKRKAIEQKYRDQIEDLYLDKKPTTTSQTKTKPKPKAKEEQSNEQKKFNENPPDLSKDIIVNDKDKKDL